MGLRLGRETRRHRQAKGEAGTLATDLTAKGKKGRKRVTKQEQTKEAAAKYPIKEEREREERRCMKGGRGKDGSITHSIGTGIRSQAAGKEGSRGGRGESTPAGNRSCERERPLTDVAGSKSASTTGRKARETTSS